MYLCSVFNLLKFILKFFLLAYLIFLKVGFWDTHKLPEVYYSSVVKSLLHFLIYWLSLNLIFRFLQLIYRRRKKQGDKYSDNVILGLQNIYILLSMFGVLVMVIGFFGIEFSQLLTAVSIVAAAIAIISKELVMDIMAGINLAFSHDLAIGDYVKIGSHKGRVVDINIYKTILHSEDDDIIYIPNSKVYFNDFINYTQKEIRKYNIDFSIHTDSFVPLSQMQKILDEVIGQYYEYMDLGSEKLKIVGINKEEITYKIQYQLNQVNPPIADEIRSKLMKAIVEKINHFKDQ